MFCYFRKYKTTTGLFFVNFSRQIRYLRTKQPHPIFSVFFHDSASSIPFSMAKITDFKDAVPKNGDFCTVLHGMTVYRISQVDHGHRKFKNKWVETNQLKTKEKIPNPAICFSFNKGPQHQNPGQNQHPIASLMEPERQPGIEPNRFKATPLPYEAGFVANDTAVSYGSLVSLRQPFTGSQQADYLFTVSYRHKKAPVAVYRGLEVIRSL